MSSGMADLDLVDHSLGDAAVLSRLDVERVLRQRPPGGVMRICLGHRVHLKRTAQSRHPGNTSRQVHHSSTEGDKTPRSPHHTHTHTHTTNFNAFT